MSSSKDQGRYQMLWDCPNCGAEKLLGLDHRHCPGCGSPQDPNRRYFPPEGEEIAVENHPYHGADKVCPACEAPNAAIAEFCVTCGSPMDQAAAARKRAESRQAAGTAFAGETVAAAQQEARALAEADRLARVAKASGAPPPGSEPPPKKSKAGCLIPVALAGVLALLALLAVFCMWKKEAAVTVTGHAWQRTVEVEKLGTVTEEAWKDQVPAGARNTSCRKEQRSTNKVKSGESCETVRKDNGDGTFSKVEECSPTYKEEPVYDQKCSYQVEKWTTARTEKASGGSVKDSPAWPKVSLARNEREGDKKETYTVSFKSSEGEALSCDTSQQRWSSLPVGSEWKASVGVLSDAVDCDELQKR